MIRDLQFTKLFQFILYWTSHRSSSRRVYEDIQLHRLPGTIVSEKEPDHYNTLGERLQEDVGTYLRYSTTKYPEQDNQLERAIQMLEDM